MTLSWHPARDQVTETARVLTSTVTTDASSGSSSKFSQTSSQTSDLVISIYNTITENGSGGFLNAMGVINYAGKSVTLKVIDPSATTTSYNSDTESGSDFASAQSTGSNDPGTASSAYVNYTPANSASLGGSSGGSASAQGGSFGSTAIKEVFDNTALYVTYRSGAAQASAHTETFAPAVVQIDLAPYTTSRIVPGSIRFTWMGHVYEDFEGVLYRDPVGLSRGTTAGVIDYRTGVAHVTDYIVSGSPTNFTLNSLWVNKGGWTTSKVFCRTPTAPVKPTGFVMSIVDVAGTQITATADLNGKISGTHCMGEIDYQTGVVDMIFGDLVLDSGLTAADKAEWWYTKALTQITAAGKVWRPWPVDPNSLRYNVVSYFYLPLDADLLGIDPVRLPQDGKVSIFRPGGFAVVGHTGKITTTAVTSNAATGTLSVSGAVADDVFTVAGIPYVLKATPIALQTPVQVLVGVSDAATATNMAAAVTTKSGTLVSASATGTVVTVTAVAPGLIGNTYTLAGNGTTLVASAATLTGGTGVSCGRVRLSRVRVLGFDGHVIHTGYTTDLEAGTVTFTNVTGYSQPVTIEHRIEDMAVVSDVQITGVISFTRALTHNYPLTVPPTSFVSSALVAGDLKARVSHLFDQATWNGTTWLDNVSGSAATGTYNDILAPVLVTNMGAITERWSLVFTNTTTFNIVGEHVGVIGTGNINSPCAPMNAATNAPYFTLSALGWGIGWSVGNILRINTVGAMTPIWVVRTVQQGPNAGIQHSFTLLSRGDVDRA